MDKNELFKQLTKHYKFADTDWWQHRQSGNWVLKHSAVLKLAFVPTPEGHRIQMPEMDDYKWLKTGEEGVYGREVVVGGTFQLLDKDNHVIRSVVAWGEANGTNLTKSVAYPTTMAVKRMLDRGVLSVLAFNQLNVYSSAEAEDFENPRDKMPISAPTPAPSSQQSAPQRPRAQPPKPPAPQAPPKKVEAQGEKERSWERGLVGYIRANGPSSKSDLCVAMQWEPSSFLSHINPLVESGVVIRTGQKRGTRYVLPGYTWDPTPPAEADPPEKEVVAVAKERTLSEEDFNAIWKDACNKMHGMGVSYVKIADFTREVTGHDSASAAFVSGKLSLDKIERIFLMGENWAASGTGALQ